MHLFVRAGILALALSSAATAHAGPAEVPRVASELLSSNRGKCVIYGTVVDSNALPLPQMRVRLRNLQTRAVEQVSSTSLHGEFIFVGLPEIPYAVEVGDRSGRVLAVSDVMASRADSAAGSVLVASTGVGYAPLSPAKAGSIAAALAATAMTVLHSPPPLTPEK